MSESAIFTDEISEECEAVIERFEEAWQQGPSRPDIESFLPAPRPGLLPPGHARLLFELVHIDLDLRLRHGEPARVEQYLARFPALEQDPAALLELIAAEYVLRRCWQTAAAPAEYLARFPRYAQQLPARLGAEAETTGRPGQPPTLSAGAAPIRPAVPGYEIVRELGRGGMGVVYQARQTAAGRIVALKTMLPGYAASAEELERFRREVAAIAHLDHPHIVPVHEVGEFGGRPYFSMKFYPGGSLARQVHSPSTDLHAHAALVETIARAVHHAHQRGVLHRDLKPSNILLDEAGQPHVADFGLAKRFDPSAGAALGSEVVGTPGYIAPEQARANQAVTTASDVYGLGAILYELLTGGPPFQAENALATLLLVVERPPQRPSLGNPRVPADLETICLKCLEKEPAQRYQSALELADDLRRWRKGEPINGRPVGRLEHCRRWCGRNPVLATLAAAVALLALVGSGGITFFALQAHGQRQEALVSASRANREKERADLEAAEAIANERLARRHLFRAEVQLAHGAWGERQLGPMSELLQRHVPKEGQEDLRGFEWYYLWRLCQGEVLLRHVDKVTCLAVSRDGTRLVAGSSDGTLKVWDPQTGQELLSFQGHDGAVSTVAFSPDGKFLASGRGTYSRPGPGEVKVWDAGTGQLLRTLGAGRGVTRAAFNPDGQQLFTSAFKEVVAWDLVAGRELLTFKGHGGFVTCMALSRDGTQLAAGGPPAVTVWDTATGELRRTIKGDKGPLMTVAFSPNGQLLATGGCCPGDFVVKLWDTKGDNLHTLTGHTSAISALAFSPDGKQVASASLDTTVRVWDTITGKPAIFSGGHIGPATGVAYGPEGEWLASASHDQTVKIWDLTRNREALTFQAHQAPITRVALSPDGQWLASSSGVAIRTGQERKDAGEVKVWDARTGRLALTLTGHEGSVLSVAFNPDGSRLASGGIDRTAKVWDARTGQELLTLPGHDGWALAVAFSPDGKQLAVGSGVPSDPLAAGAIKIYEASTGQPLRTLGPGLSGVVCVAYSPDGKFLASGNSGGSVRLWDVTTGQLAGTLKGHPSSSSAAAFPLVYSVAFGPDGRRLVSCGQDRVTRVWDTTGQELLTFNEPIGGAKSVAFSPDGERLFTSGDDGRTLKIWDTRGGQLLLNLRAGGPAVTHLAVSRDGQRLACGGANGTVVLWNAPR